MREYLKDLREKNGIPQSTLADAVGLTRQGWSLIENGKRKVTLEMLVKIASVCKVKAYKLAMQEIEYINRGA